MILVLKPCDWANVGGKLLIVERRPGATQNNKNSVNALYKIYSSF